MSLTYEVRLTPPAVRALHRLPAKVADAVLRFLDGPLSENPYRVTKPLGRELADLRSGYVGLSFRVLVSIRDDEGIVYAQRISHRADAYRPL